MFTKSQIAEIMDALELRIDAIAGDPHSATKFETKDSLAILGGKLMMDYETLGFTEGERNWLIEELENKIEMAKGALNDPELKNKAQGEINLLNNAIAKLK